MRRVVTLVGCATALLAVVAHMLSAGAIQDRRSREYVLSLARIGASQLADVEVAELRAAGQSPMVGGEGSLCFREWSRGVVREEGVAFTAVIDQEGTVVTRWPPGAVIPPMPQWAESPAENGVYDLDLEGERSGLVAALWPVNRGGGLAPVARVCVGAVPPPMPTWTSRYVALFAVVVAGCAFAVVAAGNGHLRRGVFQPLGGLLHPLMANNTKAAVRWLPTNRDDELGTIAREIQALCEELEHSQRKTVRLEESIESIVENKTRHINSVLNKVKQQADCDSLTGLANRRFIDNRLEQVFADLRKREEHLALVMLDVDNFKPLNDVEGHAAGDTVLRFLGELLSASLRETDAAVRYGGDEFVLILPGLSSHQARDATERIIRMFARQVAAMRIKTPVTLSAGVASTVDVPASSGFDLLQRADEALYRSKRSGKNVVAMAEG